MELSQVLQALRNADAAGDEEAARRLAQIAQSMAQAGDELPAAPEEKPKTGIGAALGKGLESMLSSGQTAVESLTGSPEEAARRGLQRGEDIGKRYAEQTSFEKVKEAYAKRGLLPAAGEAISQIPAALAEQAPNLAAMAGTARAGAALGSLAGPVGTVVGGVAGAVLPSLVQQFGGNIERQAQEGAPINRGAAAAAAAPQAALDVAGSFIPLGGRLVSKLTGIPLEGLLGKSAAATAKLADESLLKTLAKGTAVGAVAEIPTEITQQMLERAQAGLSLTSPDALAEYGQTAYQVGLLAPLGALGRYSERAGARGEIAEQQAGEAKQRRMEALQAEEQQRKDEAQAKLAEEARRQTPDYAIEIGQQYDTLLEQYNDLRKQLKQFDKKNMDPAAKARFADLQAQTEELHKQLSGIAPEYNRTKPVRDQIAQQAQAAEVQRLQDIETQAQQEVPQETQAQQYFQSPQATLPGFEPVETVTQMPEVDTQAESLKFYQQKQELAQLLESHQQQESDAAAKGDIAALKQLKQRRDMLQNEYDYVSKHLNLLGGFKPTGVDTAKIQAQLDKAQADLKNLAGEGYDPAVADKLLTKIDNLNAQLAEAGGVQQTFSKEQMAPRELYNEPMISQADVAISRNKQRGLFDIESQEQEALAEAEQAREQAATDAEREKKITPEVLALQRIAAKPAYSSSINEGQISSKVDDLVDMLIAGTPAQGRVIEGAHAEPTTRADILRAQLSYADATSNKELASTLKKQLADLNEPESAQQAGDMAFGLAAKQAGIEGRLSGQAKQANIATRMATAQLDAYDRLSDFVQRIREGNQNVPDARKQTLTNAVRKMQDTVIGFALNEADARRIAEGKAPLTTAEKLSMVGRMNDVMNELVERGTSMFHKPAYQQAQMRGSQIVVGAKETVQPAGKRLFNNYEAASKALRGQLRDAIDKAAGVAAPAPVQRTAKEPKRIVPELKRQWQVASERSVEKQFEAAYDRAKSDEDYRTLKDMEAKFKNLSPEAQDLALEQARFVEIGHSLSIPPQLKQELADLRTAGVSDTGQAELFTGESEKGVTRTTPARFQKFLSGKEVAKMKAQLAEEQRIADFQAKRSETIANRIAAEEKAAKDFQEKMLASNAKSDLQKAKDALSKLTSPDSRATEAIKMANAINKHRNGVRIRMRSMIAQIKASMQKAKRQEKDIKQLLDYTQGRLDAELANGETASMNELALWTQARDTQAKALADVQKTIPRIQRALDAANKTYNRVIEDHASSTIDNSIIREGEKFQRKVDRAQAAVNAAQEAEALAMRLRKAQPEASYEPISRPATQTVEDWLKSQGATIGDTTRVYRNTADDSVQAKVVKQRGAIAKIESEYETAHMQYQDALLSGDKEQAATHKLTMEQKLRSLESGYNAMYEVLNNAPLVKVTAQDTAAIRAQEELDAAQQKLADAMLADFRSRNGLPVFKLSERKLGPVLSDKGRIKQEVKPATVAQEERKAKLAAEGPTPALEKLAETRAKLAEVERQLQYMKDNPSATKAGREKQAAARKAAIAQRTDLRAKVASLTTEQRGVVKEQRAEVRARKEVRTAGREMVRSAGRLQDVIDAGESPDKLTQLASTMAAGKPLAEEIQPELGAARVMQQVSDTTADPVYKALAERLKMLLGNTKITLVDDLRGDDGQAAFGTASADGSSIELDRRFGKTEQTVLHEGVHAATERVLRMPEDQLTKEQLAAKRELAEIYNAVKHDPDFKHPELLASLSEFAAEATTSPTLRAYMQAKPWTLKHMWESFKSAILRLLGVDVPRNMHEAALAAVDKLMTKVPRPTVEDNVLATPRLSRTVPSEFKGAVDVANRLVAKQKTWADDIKANATGLAFETQMVDRFAGFERLRKYMDKFKGYQMMYFLRMYDQRMNFVSQSAANGALQLTEKTRADGRKEYIVESQPGASLKNVAEILRGASDMVGGVDNASRLFTMYLAARRAENAGFNKLNFGDQISQAELKSAMNDITGNADLHNVFKEARQEYNEYNEGLVRFAQATGALSKEDADALLKNKDYVPFYRERNGVVELMIGGEAPIKIGSIKEQPYLQSLIGGDTAILDFMTSSVQNTNMLTDMALRNLATKNAVMELHDIGAAVLTERQTSGTDVVKYKDHGKDMYAIINSEAVDPSIPADLLVKGMEGIPTQMSTLLRLASVPSRLLRRAVTLSPTYAARMLFRDSLAAPLLAGADFKPVLGALKEIGSPAGKTLEQRGVVGGQIFTGGQEDISKIMRDIAGGKGGWDMLINKAETMTMEADALTRRAQYNSYIKQGLSEMEATLMALESMNFNKRGASPSVHIANALIPFFNAQIQSLNVLYKAFAGKMPFNEKLKTREKLLKRGLTIAVASFVYAAMMQDDEAYKNATPDQKYGNWFVRIPGVDEPLRLPIPFEVGYIFKALPEALYNSMVSKHGGEEAVKAFQQILLNTIPGGSSYGIPQVMRPAIEAGLGKSFYTGRDILSVHEKTLAPEAQFRANTSELAKMVGQTAGVSPIVLEELVRGYTGTMGVAFLQALSLPFSSTSPEQAYKRLSEMPVIGSAFQPNDAGGVTNAVYDKMVQLQETKRTVDDYINRGELDRAKALIEAKAQEYAAADVGSSYIGEIRKLSQLEVAVRASSMTPEQKREQLDSIRQMKIRLANTVRNATDAAGID